MFRPDENRRGACDFAPDCVRSTIDAVSCVGCAQCLLYHCYADSEGDFAPQPCSSCVTSESGARRGGHQQLHEHHPRHHHHHNHNHHQQRHSCHGEQRRRDDDDDADDAACCGADSPPKRWFGLALLSLVVPCLWCYLPLRACYRCGVRCGCCGRPHEAA